MCRYIVCLGFLLMIIGCKKDRNDSDCGRLQAALLNEDSLVKTYVESRSRIVGRISPGAGTDEQKAKLELLATKLNGCGVRAEVYCLWCADTNPPISEIKVSFTFGGADTYRLIDVFSEPGEYIQFVAIHE